jgi:hypothetical protein
MDSVPDEWHVITCRTFLKIREKLMFRSYISLDTIHSVGDEAIVGYVDGSSQVVVDIAKREEVVCLFLFIIGSDYLRPN